ncbi:hypothetical protein SMAC4_12820 [Sordaria macrospora]|uniref:uncharacterized protein n=1 Tax=Sordaria macrospora TaxID=5147 RepID=UPI002B305741|nr:hypothetical protein SMAC4_12820 [Sordaria macrospora]
MCTIYITTFNGCKHVKKDLVDCAAKKGSGTATCPDGAPKEQKHTAEGDCGEH